MSSAPIETEAGELPRAITEWVREFSGDPEATVLADVTVIKYLAHGRPMFGIATSLESGDLVAALLEVGVGIVSSSPE